MATTNENQSTRDHQKDEINDLRDHFKDNIRILSSIGQFSYILKIRADQYDVSLTLQLDESYPSKAPEIIITAPRLAPDQILVVQRLLQTYSETLLNQPMILLIYQRLLRWFDENHIQSLNNNSSNNNNTNSVHPPAPPRSPTNSKNHIQSQPSLSSRNEDIESEQLKKSSMKTAEDVISRIEWDDRLNPRYFRVGYIDRFLGLQEKAFNEFDFKVDLSTISDRHSSLLAIPKHRIQYFKYNNEIIWDKETRTDLMFGSTGNRETIYDVIDRHDHLMENNHSFLTSQDETTIELEQNENNDEPRPLPRYLTLTDGVYKPNYYLSIPLNDPNFLSHTITYRDHLLSTCPSLFSSRITTTDSTHFHLTLLTLHLETVALFDQCVMVLKRLQEEIRYHCSYPERICLEFQGIETFYDRTVFIKCQQNRRLENLRSLIVERFCEQVQKQRINGMYLAGNYAEFIPHVTLLKCKRKFSSICPQEMKKEIVFGRQTIDCLQLASIGRSESDEQKDVSIFKLDLS